MPESIYWMDSQGDLYVIELKRNRTPREVVAQTLDYGSWIRGLGHDALGEIFAAYKPGTNLETTFEGAFGTSLPDEVNQNHRLIVVASELDPSTERIIGYLSGFEIPINVVFFRYMKDGDDEYLARSWLIDPAEVDVKTTPTKRRPWNQRDCYISFGHGRERHWDDARRFGFISGGGDPWYSRSLNALKEGHRVFVYVPQTGYVDVGEVIGTARPIPEFKVALDGADGPIPEAGITAPDMGHDLDDLDKCEYLVPVKWIRDEPLENAFMKPGLFANQNTAARLRDTDTITCLEQHYGLSPNDEPGSAS